MASEHIPAPPTLEVERQPTPLVRLRGEWRVQALAAPGALRRLARLAAQAPPDSAWELRTTEALDHIGAQWLWQTWGDQRPAQLALTSAQEDLFARVARSSEQRAKDERSQQPSLQSSFSRFSPAILLRGGSALRSHLVDGLALIGQLVLDVGRLLRQPRRAPWKEISANIFHTGYQALGITALVGFLIGVVLSYLSAQQLRTLGADIYLVDILGMSIIRELGPLLAAILVAGRSGSAITAQLGVMRVTEELDAMLVMGMPHGFRLILPRVLALAIAMPLLVVWTDVVALAGGVAAAQLELQLSPAYFVQQLPSAVPFANYAIGLGKGVVFGVLIALVACHFGLRIKPDTASLGQGTTLSVVTAITVVILADAVFAILFQRVGFGG